MKGKEGDEERENLCMCVSVCSFRAVMFDATIHVPNLYVMLFYLCFKGENSMSTSKKKKERKNRIEFNLIRFRSSVFVRMVL